MGCPHCGVETGAREGMRKSITLTKLHIQTHTTHPVGQRVEMTVRVSVLARPRGSCYCRPRSRHTFCQGSVRHQILNGGNEAWERAHMFRADERNFSLYSVRTALTTTWILIS